MTLEHDIEILYEKLSGSEAVEEYDRRHGVHSCGILTITTPSEAHAAILPIREQIRRKVVVELGAGVGLLAMEMAKYAESVYAIEADPAWTWAFVRNLIHHKPPNLTWIFGSAQQMVGKIWADVAVLFTRSDQEGMADLCSKLAMKTIVGYGQG